MSHVHVDRSEPADRFVVYADFLGTTRRYIEPGLVVRSRELLEQALNQCVCPRMPEHDMSLYVFSDTAVITCPRLLPLVDAVASLFAHFIGLQSDDDEDLSLWLRAGISCGRVLEVDHLKNGRSVRTIPFLDTSLPRVVKLESIRMGSRVFLDPSISTDELGARRDEFYTWRQITGQGETFFGVTECLWPLIAYDTPERLARVTQTLHGWWREALLRRQWPKPQYFDRLLHFDETVKLFVRSASRSCTGQYKHELLLSLLPDTAQYRGQPLYEWGLWFQALRGLLDGANNSHVDEIVRRYGIVREILKSSALLQHFTGELEYPDYHPFRDALVALNLHHRF